MSRYASSCVNEPMCYPSRAPLFAPTAPSAMSFASRMAACAAAISPSVLPVLQNTRSSPGSRTATASPFRETPTSRMEWPFALRTRNKLSAPPRNERTSMTRQVLVCTVVVFAAIILASPAPIVASSQASANSSPDVTQARHLFDLGNYSAAVTILTNTIARNSNDAEAQFWLARANYEQKDFDNAASHAERAVQIDPKNSLY